ncbi:MULTISPECIES: efflux RND transporter permease subunit [Cobetia]|uniref:efflux RND transporter permease subunit n=1 Tax=Cobetia TaxID=204286 RepID=UPI0009848A9B|nr:MULTISPECIES: efflux RND transporter permease subunit [Cobetia]MDA5562072.1 efflux RND transporter permease subunit [Cobetia sp. MMG027]POR08472.1 multidrug efflux RND transporter permease [Cobetia sp. MM1IDA2H-1]
MVRFFIDRPIFAWVLAIIVMLGGTLSILKLPIEQYPSLAPPSIKIQATYTGASAETVQNTVTQVIEQQMTGIDNLLYMSSTSDSTGSAAITLTFASGTDSDIAQVQVQNKLSLAEARLPTSVQTAGIEVTKSSSSFLMAMAFVSDDDSMTNQELADYVSSNVQDEIARVNGVGETRLLGAPGAMRIWLDPAKLNNYSLTPSDITAAIDTQNSQTTSGQLGNLPAEAGQQLNATIVARTLLQTPEEFGNILLKTQADGSQVYLKDVARVEKGAESYSVITRYNGKPAAGMGVMLSSGANALDTVEAVKQRLDELAPYFPEGVSYKVPYDTSPFIKLSIEEVVMTLLEAIGLVFLVMLLFLQNFRATLIPTIAVPVVLLGTFGILELFGYSINTLTMFAMVLAIGLLVDDAIVVVENVERVMHEEKLSPLEATRKSMGQITGALVGIGLVLSSVFIPMAFFPGTTGAIYRQFSVTIVAAMVLSVLVALILTPALCATLLRPTKEKTTGFFGLFNRAFDRSNARYQKGVQGMLKRTGRSMIVYVLVVFGCGALFTQISSGFLPDEDQGNIFNQVVLPAGSTQQETVEVMKKLEHHFLVDQSDAVIQVFSVAGFSFAGSGQNMGLAFVNMKPWDERERSAFDVVGKAQAYFNTLKGALAFAVNPPSIRELGNATGFDMMLVDRGGIGHEALTQARNKLMGMAAQNPAVTGLRPNGLEDRPQYNVKINELKATAMGIDLSDVYTTLSTAWGSSYVNDYLDNGRTKKVYVQGQAEARMQPDDLNKWYVNNSAGEMIPLSSIATGSWTFGSPQLQRYNGVSAMELLGTAAEGYSTGEAMAAMQSMVDELGGGVALEWTGISLQESQSSGMAPYLYAISLVFVFLCLAALYESWSIPFSVMLVVPLGVLGALLATWLRGLDNDVYFQVGLVTTIGLSAKNAILIVEFAKDLEVQGRSLIDATMEAVRMRLRPILMTSMAFTLGAVPLAISTGAGAASRHAIGNGVIGGMISATVLAIFLVPVCYVVVRRVFGEPKELKRAHEAASQEDDLV